MVEISSEHGRIDVTKDGAMHCRSSLQQHKNKRVGVKQYYTRYGLKNFGPAGEAAISS